MRFAKEWFRVITPLGKIVYRPVLVLEIKEKTKIEEYRFIVDSGADISLMSKYVANRIGIDWEKGKKTELRGISQKKECLVEGRIHEINVTVPDIKLEIQIPICFVDGNAPFLLGREGFFDYFRVIFEKVKLRTVFELTENEK